MRHPLLLAVLLAAGCGAAPKAVLVISKLLQEGKALVAPTKGLPPGDLGVRVGFFPADGKTADRAFAQISPADGPSC